MAHDMDIDPLPEGPAATLQAVAVTPSASAGAPRHALPAIPEFHGTAGTYRAWRTQLRVKLQIDGARMGGELGKIAAILLSLKGNAQRLCSAQMARYVESPTATAEEVLSYLDLIFQDPDRERAAQEQWFRLRQGTTPFEHFYAEFERLLAEAGGEQWDERIKVGQLQRATSNEIVRIGIAAGPAPNSLSLSRRYRQIATDLASLKAPATLFTTNPATAYAAGPPLDPMDIDVPGSFASYPPSTSGHNRGGQGGRPLGPPAQRGNNPRPNNVTRVNPYGADGPGLPTDAALRGRTAKRVSAEVLESRKAAGACFRCGRLNCRVAVCPLAAPPPPNRPPWPAATFSTYVDPNVEDVVEPSLIPTDLGNNGSKN